MPQLPDQIRLYAAAIAKYHFWILGLIVPLVLVPMLFQGRARLDGLISAQRSQIEGQVSALNAIKARQDHPNEALAEAVAKSTEAIQAETMAEWKTLWSEQQAMRAWPKSLGDDFVKDVGRLKAGGALSRAFLVRYQNAVPALVRELPARMGVTDLTLDAAAGGVGPGGPVGVGEGGGRGPAPRFGGDFGPGGPGFAGGPGFPGGPGGGSRPVVSGTEPPAEWAAADQRRLLASFTWEKPPSTVQVLLAQEELWVYGILCDVIKRVNSSPTDPFSVPIPFIEHIALGFPAAEDQPGGQGTSRIVRETGPGVGAGGEGMPPEGGMAGVPGMAGPGEMGTGGAPLRPPHPRFDGAVPGGPMLGGPAFSPEGGGDPAAATPASPDDMLRDWIYVDFTGKPLTSAELASSADARIVHLMPFTLRMMMDQRKLDTLLADLATNTIPIDVRQVRINPGSAGVGPPGQGGPAASAVPAAPATSPTRPFDVLVELRGTVGIAAPPDEATLGGVPAGAPGA